VTRSSRGHVRPPTIAGVGLIVAGVVILNMGGIRTG
jgi:hypothetical protein